MIKMSIRWLKNEPPNELEFQGVSEDGLRTLMGASSVAGVPKRHHSPKDMVAMGVAGCTGVDVVSILKKMRQPLQDLVIDTEFTVTDEHPRVFDHCVLTYKFFGDGLDSDRVLRAAALSYARYCGVSAMIKRSGCSFEPRLLLNGNDLSAEFHRALDFLEQEGSGTRGQGNLSPIRAAVLLTGNELLAGKTADTNGRFIIRELNRMGIRVKEVRIVGDDRSLLVKTLDELTTSHDIVFMTGGLGPTQDDLTAEVVAQAFHLPLEFSQPAWDICQRAFQLLGRTEIPESNRKQAMLPAGAGILANGFGTAAGFYVQKVFPQHNCMLFALPGVPWECEQMFMHEVKPQLNLVGSTFREWGPWHVWGIGESALQTQLSAVEHDLLAKYPGLHISYQAHAGYVSYGFKVEESAQSNAALPESDAYDVASEVNRIEQIFDGRLLYRGSQSLVERLHEKYSARGARLALAESCTGGRIAGELTSRPGISSVFVGGVVTYSNESKSKLLGVSAETLLKHGAVSHPTAHEMASGALHLFDSSVALSVTGIAGPGGETPEKPVGTVCFAVALSEALWAKIQNSTLQEMLKLQGWERVASYSNSSDVVLCVEKRFGKHLSRELVQKRACVFALCTLVLIGECLGGVGQ
jgi:nicotinamide-nucleotide amidase